MRYLYLCRRIDVPTIFILMMLFFIIYKKKKREKRERIEKNKISFENDISQEEIQLKVLKGFSR